MSSYLDKFEIDPKGDQIKYMSGTPLKLTEKFSFYHNKNFFRKELNNLQNLMKNYVGTTLTASGIRDSYLAEKYTENYLIVLFTDNEKIRTSNEILASKSSISIKSSCYYLEVTQDYFLLLTRDIEGLKVGIQSMELVLKQVLEHYFAQKNLDEYIQIRPFQLNSCHALKEG